MATTWLQLAARRAAVAGAMGTAGVAIAWRQDWPWPRRKQSSLAGAETTSTPLDASIRDEIWKEFGVRRAILSKSGEIMKLLCSDAAGEATDVDAARLRDMKGEQLPVELNPGLRVNPNFVDEAEEAALEVECRELIAKYGYAFKAEEVQVMHADAGGRVLDEQGAQQAFSRRVTGRPEMRDGAVGGGAPWGYGAELKLQELPPLLRSLVERVQASRFKVGALRDLTINNRTGSFFKIDPHVDPLADGPHVAILGLTSGAVLTFTPKDELPRQGVEVEQLSWTDKDIDVIFRKRSLVLFTGEGRYQWKHAMRAGFEIDHPALGGTRVCDFWGSMANILPRKPERFSIVMSFADP
eukprot:gb/GFBE01013680.1/.p1 GENE.gb/GFBE01013680.1/~~gb/GFBE01013680.1/.p1  ORF type:complete len:354 (+),score=80.72 gb/GFBE01013680.1/:1-1062(+)